MLIALISVIFTQFMSSVRYGPLANGIAVAIFVTVNALISQWLARRGHSWPPWRRSSP